MERKTRLDRLYLANGGHRPVTVYLEPWGEQIILPPDGRFEVKAVGPEGEFLELVWGDDEVTIYGWSWSTISILSEGKEVAGFSGIPAPPLPGCSEAEFQTYIELLKTFHTEDT